MKMINLTRGYAVQVDDEDFERLSAMRWHAYVAVKKFVYAVTNVRINKEPPAKYKLLKLHRYLLDAPAGRAVDHIDGNTLNCCRANLRLCNMQENAHNRRPRLLTSPFKGVSWQPSRNKWMAAIKVDGKDKTLGRFANEVDAARAYNEAAQRHFGAFAWLNTIPAP